LRERFRNNEETKWPFQARYSGTGRIPVFLEFHSKRAIFSKITTTHTPQQNKKSQHINITNQPFITGYNTMPKEFKMPTMEQFRMLKAKRKRLREEQESMDVDVTLTC